jgi:hypothetical protein
VVARLESIPSSRSPAAPVAELVALVPIGNGG